MIGTSAKNITSICNLPAGGYILKLVSVDGTFNPDVEVSVLVASIPDDVSGYQIWLTSDGTHCVEVMESAKAKSNPVYNIRVDGTMIDYQNCEVEIGKATASSQSKCSMSTSKDSRILGIGIGSYAGYASCKNGLWLRIYKATYAESHSRTSTRYSDVHNANHIVTGTNKYGDLCYTGSWVFAKTMDDMYMVFDIDKMEAVDFRHPNWFYGEANYTRYGAYGSPYTGTFTYLNKIGV